MTGLYSGLVSKNFSKNGFQKTQAASHDGSFLAVRTRNSNQGRPIKSEAHIASSNRSSFEIARPEEQICVLVRQLGSPPSANLESPCAEELTTIE